MYPPLYPLFERYMPFIGKVYKFQLICIYLSFQSYIPFFGPQGGAEREEDSSFMVGITSNYFLGLL